MFSPLHQALDLTLEFSWGRLLRTPMQLGTWALLQSMGSQNHAPQLCWIRPDLLACVWMAGGGEGTAGMSVAISLLPSDSGSWSIPQFISQDDQRSEQNPLLFVSDNKLHLIHSAQRVRDPNDFNWNEKGTTTFSMQWTAALRLQSLDLKQLDADVSASWGMAAWSSRQDLLDQPCFCRHPPVWSSNDQWLLPVYRSLEAGGSFGHDHSEVLPLGLDGFVSGPARPVPDSTGRVHGSIVRSQDGHRWLQFFRSRLADRIYRSSSVDDGKIWSSPEPIDLPSNNSSIHAVRLASSRLAIVFNRFCFEPDSEQPQAWGEANWPRTRWPLSIALSEDDGDSWPWIRDIDPGFGFCGPRNWTLNGQLAYPSMVEGLPGELHVTYSWAGREAIRYVCLTEDDILGVSAGIG